MNPIPVSVAPEARTPLERNMETWLCMTYMWANSGSGDIIRHRLRSKNRSRNMSSIENTKVYTFHLHRIHLYARNNL